MDTVSPNLAKTISEDYQKLRGRQFEWDNGICIIYNITAAPKGILKPETAAIRYILTPEFIEGDNWKVIAFISKEDAPQFFKAMDLDELCKILDEPFNLNDYLTK